MSKYPPVSVRHSGGIQSKTFLDASTSNIHKGVLAVLVELCAVSTTPGISIGQTCLKLMPCRAQAFQPYHPSFRGTQLQSCFPRSNWSCPVKARWVVVLPPAVYFSRRRGDSALQAAQEQPPAKAMYISSDQMATRGNEANTAQLFWQLFNNIAPLGGHQDDQNLLSPTYELICGRTVL